MDFKRLSEVEKLAEVPAGASALAEADGKIVRVPFGGGANLEDLMFDLEVDMSSSGRLEFTNKEQLQKVYDNNMSVYIVCYAETSGGRHIFRFACPFVKNLCPVLTSNRAVYALGNYDDEGWRSVSIYFDPEKYNQDGTLAVTDGSYMVYNSSRTVARVYASIL